MWKPVRTTAAVLVVLLCGPPAVTAAEPATEKSSCRPIMPAGDTATLLVSGDVAARRLAAMRAPPGSADHDLLGGLLAASLLEDAAAAARLNKALTRPDDAPRFFAGVALAGVWMRQGRYAAAAEVLRSTLANGDAAGAGEDAWRAAHQLMAVADSLRDVPAQVGPAAVRGAVTLQRDAAGLGRAALTINDQPADAIIDTGANLSVMVASKAETLGLRLLERSVTVSSPLAESTEARLAVADRLTIGGATFDNVVFIVFPDAVLTFAEGAYRIDVILGFPVLAHLGRLHFVSDGDGDRLSFVRPAARPPVSPMTANLFVEGLTPKVVGCTIPGQLAVQFALDSGAQATSVRPRFGRAVPDALGRATTVTRTQGGVGGTLDQSGLRLPPLQLDLGGRQLLLENLVMTAEAADDAGDHGRIGQDVLRAKGGYVLDFIQMRFELGGATVDP